MRGIILPLVSTLIVMFGVLMFVLIALITNVEDITTTVKSDVIDPSVDEVRTNSFLVTPPREGGEAMANILSRYMATGEDDERDLIEASMRRAFPNEGVALFPLVREPIIVGRGSEDFHIISRNITLPVGKVQEMRMVYYE